MLHVSALSNRSFALFIGRDVFRSAAKSFAEISVQLKLAGRSLYSPDQLYSAETRIFSHTDHLFIFLLCPTAPDSVIGVP